MMKGFVSTEESMSNLTCELSASSSSRIESDNNNNYFYSQHHQISFPPPPPPPPKKKRNLPGNPDPKAEVIALSPRTLLATNRFVCEICKKGFQRDQNLQLHRRGHNLPWKLKQKTNREERKKVYVCPETTCVHHEPSRALGDLTGIKKHFSRKHGEKKWKCQKCSKKYAVQSDWKAHSKICGTREYRCDCGKVFSRRDSFITHRAFCDVLAEESGRAITGIKNHHHHSQQFAPSTSSLNIFNSFPYLQNPNPSSNPNSPHLSATALLQKATQMGVSMSKPHHQEAIHMSAGGGLMCSSAGSGLVLSSREELSSGSFANKAVSVSVSAAAGCFIEQFPVHDMIMTPPHQNRIGEGLTRDFLGLKAFPDGQRDQFIDISGLSYLNPPHVSSFGDQTSFDM